MKVFYRKGEHIIISFPSNELGHALKVLKALAKAFNASFILTAARELEDDLRPNSPTTTAIGCARAVRWK